MREYSGESGESLALPHFTIGCSCWLCGWLSQVVLTAKLLLSVEDKLASFLGFVGAGSPHPSQVVVRWGDYLR